MQLSAAAPRRGCHFQPGDRYQPCPECGACHGCCPECGKVHFPWCPWIPEIDPRLRRDPTIYATKRFCLADPVAVSYAQCPNGHCWPRHYCATHAKPGPTPAECGMCFGDGKPGVTVTVAETVADEHHVRRVLKRQGWAVGIRQKLQSGERRAQRKDFCPEHKPAA